MPDTEYVAATKIVHGLEDGTRLEIPAGANVAEYDLELDDLMRFWEAGSLAVKGQPGDPNLIDYYAHPQQTTPAMVQDALEAQVRLAGGPGESAMLKDA